MPLGTLVPLAGRTLVLTVERVEIKPFGDALRVSPEGGSASFAWPVVPETIADRLIRHIERSLCGPAELRDLRFVDADGRDTSGLVPGGVVLVGPSTAPRDEPDRPTTLEELP